MRDRVGDACPERRFILQLPIAEPMNRIAQARWRLAVRLRHS